MKKLKIGISHGDTNGVSYEMILKAMEDPTMMDLCIPIVYGSPKIAATHRKALELGTNYINIASGEEALEGRLNLVDCISEEVKVEYGQPTPESARTALKSLDTALADLKNGNIDALVTMPLTPATAQAVDSTFQNQTKRVSAKFEGEGCAPMTMMIGESLHIALLTEDVPMSALSESISQENVLEKLRQLNQALKRDFLTTHPRIAVLALNPTPEKEEEEILKPVLAQAEEERICAYGPLSADDFFGNGTYRHYDGVLAMYSSQVSAPFRLLAPEDGICYISGLPVVCTSPNEGTHMDKAGKGESEPTVLNKAIYQAIDIIRNRERYDEAYKDPLPKLFHDKREDKKNMNIE